MEVLRVLIVKLLGEVFLLIVLHYLLLHVDTRSRWLDMVRWLENFWCHSERSRGWDILGCLTHIWHRNHRLRLGLECVIDLCLFHGGCLRELSIIVLLPVLACFNIGRGYHRLGLDRETPCSNNRLGWSILHYLVQFPGDNTRCWILESLWTSMWVVIDHLRSILVEGDSIKSGSIVSRAIPVGHRCLVRVIH